MNLTNNKNNTMQATILLSDVLKVALRGDMVMAPNSIKTKEEEGTMVIKSEVMKTDGRSVDMFAPAWVQENTQVLKSKVESSKVLKTKVAETKTKLMMTKKRN